MYTDNLLTTWSAIRRFYIVTRLLSTRILKRDKAIVLSARNCKRKIIKNSQAFQFQKFKNFKFKNKYLSSKLQTLQVYCKDALLIIFSVTCGFYVAIYCTRVLKVDKAILSIRPNSTLTKITCKNSQPITVYSKMSNKFEQIQMY